MTTHYIYGLHAIRGLLEKNAKRIDCLFVSYEREDKKIQNILNLAKQFNVPIEFVSRNQLVQLTKNNKHQGVVALCHPFIPLTENDLPHFLKKISDNIFLLILDGIQDPHNLGACMRSADATGVHAIIAPKDRSVGLNETVIKVASGAAEAVPFIQVTNLARTLTFLKEQNIWLYGAASEAEVSLYQQKFSGHIAIILGAEGAGLRRLTKERCDQLLKIPMHGSVSSLNVSVATGIFLFEVIRQKLY